MVIKSLGRVENFQLNENKKLERKEEKKEEKKMKIMLIGESMDMPSGFGGQMKILAEGLANKGHSVVVLTSTNFQNTERTNPQEWHISNIKDIDAVDRIIHRYAPDALIVFWYLHMVTYMTQLKGAPANCPIYFWVPWEGSTPPNQWDVAFRRVPKNRVVHLSEFARSLWSKHVDSNVVIPHAYHPDFEHKSDKKQLRRKWAQRLRFPLFDDSIIILNVDRNIRHKRWDATFDFISKISKTRNEPVQLIAHTKIKEEQMPKDHEAFDLASLVKLYGVEDQVVFTGFNWTKSFSRSELAELYSLSDFRLSTSEGEGYGIPSVECAVCECPQIVNDTTTAKEIFGDNCEFLVEPSCRELHWNALFQVPDVNEMVSRANQLLDEGSNGCVEQVKNRVKTLFSSEVVVNKWNDLLTKNERKYDYSARWGYQSYFSNKISIRDLAIVISKMGESLRIFELGAYDGVLADFIISLGLSYTGIEWEKESIDLASSLSQLYITHADIKSNWPNADVIVFTDLPERVSELDPSATFKILERAALYDWLFIRNNTYYKWGVPLVDKSSIPLYLESKDMLRRHDLEIMATSFAPNFNHEIWQRGKDSSYIPKAIAVSSKK